VNETVRPSTVPLEAGIGPENPPCSVCGEPLFGWVTSPAGAPVRRCESCGLGVVGDSGDEAEAIAALERLRAGAGNGPRYRIANRGSLQAWLGGGGWAPIGCGTRYLFTPEAVRRLVADRGQELERIRWRPAAGLATMWGTLLNSFTWGHNVALAALGRAAATPARRRWQRGLDGFISIAASLPVLLVAVLLEGGAAIAGRGGMLELTLRLK
jgi:hypothetical protein